MLHLALAVTSGSVGAQKHKDAEKVGGKRARERELHLKSRDPRLAGR